MYPDLVNLDIHERSAPCKWGGGTPRQPFFSPSIQVCHSLAVPRKSIHYRSLRYPNAPVPPLAIKTRTRAGSHFLDERFECSIL
ncbi:hypothetical protein AVEN_195290-1 [Araneus ventricosus]|uniref:Uncharacterized protein n=1 Tax=Araneus ventricosus TaxID=182803 RepID=A0A4Y2G3B4_ARAVE|nr:hypothetical protein AVEN_195290-1 [Araneus ventricosus]